MDGIDRTTCAPLTGKTGETGSIISQCSVGWDRAGKGLRTAYAYND